MQNNQYAALLISLKVYSLGNNSHYYKICQEFENIIPINLVQNRKYLYWFS